MKPFNISICLLTLLSLGVIAAENEATHQQINQKEISTPNNPDVLMGSWKLDMSPMIKTDDNFAMMRIEKIDKNTFKGVFYREGVVIRNGQIYNNNGVIYGALVSGDNSGEYNSSFYFKDGILYGSTHAIDRGFLAVWEAVPVNNP